MNPGKPKRKIRNLLLDKRFQLKYTLAVVLISSTISVGLGYFLYQAHRESSRVHSLGSLELDREMKKELGEEDRQVLFQLALFLGGLVLCLGVVGIVATHKIAGPAYAMRQTLSKIADGELPAVRTLRRRDELKAVVSELRRMVDHLREREGKDVSILKEALSWLRDYQPDSKEVSTQLEKLIRQKEHRLEEGLD